MLPGRGAKMINLSLAGKQPNSSRGRRTSSTNSRSSWPPEKTPVFQSQQPLPLARPPSRSAEISFHRPSVWYGGLEKKTDDQKRGEVSSQLESITERMFALLDDYEDGGVSPGNKDYIDELNEQVDQIENRELRGNIQLMMLDYNDMCVERDELLFSLQDWFEEGHIDDLIEDMHRSGEDSETVKKSLMDSKAASNRLKVINKELSKSGSTEKNHLRLEKVELEKELMKSKNVYDSIQTSKGGGQNQEVADSWKLAANDIFSVLTKVRNDGLSDIHELEDEIKKIVTSMNHQSIYLETIQEELKRQRELVSHEEFLRRKLEEDNDILEDDVEEARRMLYEKDKKLKSTEDLVRQLKKQVGAMDQKGRSSQSSRPASTSKGRPVVGGLQNNGQVEDLRSQLEEITAKCTVLTEENQVLVGQNEELLAIIERLQEELLRLKEATLSEPHTQPTLPSSPTLPAEPHPLSSPESRPPSSSELLSPLLSEPHPLSSSEPLPPSPSEPLSPSPSEPHSTLLPETHLPSSPEQLPPSSTEPLASLPATPHSPPPAKPHPPTHAKPHPPTHAKSHPPPASNTPSSVGPKTRKASPAAASTSSKTTARSSVVVRGGDKVDSKRLAELEGLLSRLQAEKERSEAEREAKEKELEQAKQDAAILTYQLTDADSENKQLQIRNTFLENKIMSLELALSRRGISHSEFQTPHPTITIEPCESQPQSVLPYPTTLGLPLAVEAEDTHAASLQLVAGMVQKLNTDSATFEDTDSTALTAIKEEMGTMCANIQTFMDYSSNLISREAAIVAEATETLESKMKEAGVPEIALPASAPAPSDSVGGSRKKDRVGNSSAQIKVDDKNAIADLKFQVENIGIQVINTLKTSERLFTKNISNRRGRLNSMAQAMAAHKKKQHPSWIFPLSEEEGFVLNATPLHRDSAQSTDTRSAARGDSRLDAKYALKRRLQRQEISRKAGYGQPYGMAQAQAYGQGNEPGRTRGAPLSLSGGGMMRNPGRLTQPRPQKTYFTGEGDGDSVMALPIIGQGNPPGGDSESDQRRHHRLGNSGQMDLSRLALLSSLRMRNRQRQVLARHGKLGGILNQPQDSTSNGFSTSKREWEQSASISSKKALSGVAEALEKKVLGRNDTFLQASGKAAYLDRFSHSSGPSSSVPGAGAQALKKPAGSRDTKLPRLGLGKHSTSSRHRTF